MSQIDRHTLESLEFLRIKEHLAKLCYCDGGRRFVDDLAPGTDPLIIESSLLESREMKEIIEFEEIIPLEHLEKIEPLVEKSRVAGSIFDAEQLKRLSDFQKLIVALFQYRIHKEEKYPKIVTYLAQLKPLNEVITRIDAAIDRGGEIKDSASDKLRRIRSEKVQARAQILNRLQKVLGEKAHRSDRTDDIVTMRDGRYVIAIVDSEFNPRTAVIHDRSRTGATLYVEPTEAIELNNKLKQVLLDEVHEIERILLALSELVHSFGEEIARNWQLYGRLDFLHAKGKLAVEQLAIMPKLRTDSQLSLQAAYHPLLLMSAKKRSDVVPLSVELGFDHNVIIITGPNTGGKTVALKTVGLLALMTQSGLLIPADEKSQMGIFSKIFADIGDEQSIELSLSTYSSHIARITYALKHCDRYSLLLFDELGVGTDPKEGSALAESVIEYVAMSGAKCIVTTHYSALKAIAESNKKVENASMEFNRQTFQPTYRFRTGLPGSSYALEVASRLGMPPEILTRAGELVGTQERSLADLIARLEAELMAADSEREQLRVRLQKAEEADTARKSQQAKVDEREKQLLREGLEEANRLVEETRKKMEALMQEMREPQVTKSDFKRARKTIDEFRSELAQQAEVLHPQRQAFGAPPGEGDTVFIERLRTDGELLEIFPDGKRGKVRVGRIVYTMELADLRKIGANEATPEIPQGVNYQPYKDDVQMEISLRGLTVEEARERLDKYFDEIALAHLPSVRIVHGKGTGALRRMVREYLAKNKMVESFQLGEWNEGSWGVTVVKLKS